VTFRTSLKAVTERGAIAAGLPRLARARSRAVTILAYHDIVPERTPAAIGDVSLHLPQQAFARQLDMLVRDYSVVPLAVALNTVAPPARPRVAITFDDACIGALTAGVTELERRALPATVFVAPGRCGDTFWWDALAAPGGDGLDETTRVHALEALAGEQELIRAWAQATGRVWRSAPAHARAATESELGGALRYPGLTLGAHTWSHPNLPRLGADRVAEEIERPLGWLRDRFGERVLAHVSYPYGAFDSQVMDAARRAGYQAAFRITGGRMRAGDADSMALPRVNVPSGVSDAGFALRVAGLVSR